MEGITNFSRHLRLSGTEIDDDIYGRYHRHRRHRAGGARDPKFLTGARGHNRIYGAPVKNKKINEKAKYSAKEVFSVSSIGKCHLSTALSITLWFMSAQTAVRHRFSSSTSCIAVCLVNAFLNQPLYFVVDWIQV